MIWLILSLYSIIAAKRYWNTAKEGVFKTAFVPASHFRYERSFLEHRTMHEDLSETLRSVRCVNLQLSTDSKANENIVLTKIAYVLTHLAFPVEPSLPLSYLEF